MYEPNLTCWPLHYAIDPFRQETRNIGVIVHCRGESCAVLMGDMAQDEVDSRFFCRAFGFSEDLGWVYREWARWFQGLAREAKLPEVIQQELDQLKKSGAKFAAGEMFIKAGYGQGDLHAMAKRVFAEIVSVPKLSKRSRFEAEVDEVVFQSEIEFGRLCYRNVELEIQTLQGPLVFVRLAFFVEAPMSLGIKLLRFEGTTDQTTAGQVNDIAYSFDALTSHGILLRKRCVVLHDLPAARRKHHLNRLERHACLLSLSDSRTPFILRKLIESS